MNSLSPERAALSWNTLPMEVFAVGRARNPVTTPRAMTGASISRPGNLGAMSRRPTLLRVPDFSSPAIQPQLRGVLPSRVRCTRLKCRIDVGDHDQPVECTGTHVTGVD